MTKKEYRRYINKLFYEYVNNVFPQYTIDSSEGYGRIYLINNDSSDHGSIMYHQSEHYVCSYKWVPDDTKLDMAIMEKYLNSVIIPLADDIYSKSK